MSKTKLAVALGVVLVLAPVAVRVGTDAWGRSKLAGYEASWKAAVPGEKARVQTLRHPVLRGEPIQKPIGPVYGPLIAAVKSDAMIMGRVAKLRETSFADASTREAIEVLERNAKTIEALQEATRLAIPDWQLALEDGWRLKIPEPLFVFGLTRLALLDAREKARTDPRAAEDRIAAVARFGTDFRAGAAGMIAVGTGVLELAYDELGKLVAERGADLDLDRADKDLSELEPVLPDAAAAFRLERNAIGVLAEAARDPDYQLGGLAGSSFILGHAATELDFLLGEAEKAMTLPRPERGKRLRELRARAEGSWNPMLSHSFYTHMADGADNVHARFRMARVAIRLERERRKSGSYPSEVEGMPEDPHAAPAKLRYTSNGKGYRLWSVGEDEKDGGIDLVLEKKS